MDSSRIRFVVMLAALLAWLASPAMAQTGRSLLAVPLDDATAAAAKKSGGALRTLVTAPPDLFDRYLAVLVDAGELRLTNGLTDADVTPAPGRAAEAAGKAAELGGRCGEYDDGQAAMRCQLPPGSLADFARLDAVAFIDAPSYAAVPPDPSYQPFPKEADASNEVESRLAGNKLTEGIISSGAINWIQEGITGKGVKVGVIDSGFENYPERQAEGNLPAVLTVRNFVANETQGEVDGTTAHGTACAEVVYDMAPGCELYLAKVKEPAEVGDALVWFIAEGVDVISSSVGFNNTDPGDGTGVFPTLAGFAEAGNIVWVNSAGNDRLTHYDGVLNPLLTTWSGWPITAHLFEEPLGWINVYGESAANPETIGAFVVLKAALRWSDWPDATTDLDLYLARWDANALGEGQGSWRVVDESIRSQSGQPGDKPVEEIVYITDPGVEDTKYGYFIRSYDGASAVTIEFFAPRGETAFLSYRVNARSLNNMAQAREVLAVGAMDFDGYEARDYSAQGPVNGPGGILDGGYGKPDLCGYARVTTATYGYRAFTGTSAAAPHVAGAAALLRGRFPSWTAAKVREGLYRRSIDVGDPGLDDRCGYGRLAMGLPPHEAGAWFLLMLLDQVESQP